MDALKILMVDDEERMRKLVKDFLTNKGFSVVEAGDGEEALEIFFAQKGIALILLDVMMPKMDGWEVLKGSCCFPCQCARTGPCTAPSRRPYRSADTSGKKSRS